MTRKKKRNVVQEIFHDEFYFGDDTLACEKKTIKREIREFVSQTQDPRPTC